MPPDVRRWLGPAIKMQIDPGFAIGSGLAFQFGVYGIWQKRTLRVEASTCVLMGDVSEGNRQLLARHAQAWPQPETVEELRRIFPCLNAKPKWLTQSLNYRSLRKHFINLAALCSHPVLQVK